MKKSIIEPYTVAITSCGRFDLLQRTLTSLFPNLIGPIAKLVIIDDSGDRSIENVVDRFVSRGIQIDLTVNKKSIGQIRSLDHIYSKMETEYVFACEDDWEFISGGFIAKTFDVIHAYDSCSKCMITGLSKVSKQYAGEITTPNGESCYVGSSITSSPYTGFLFAPGLTRMREYRIVGPYADLGVKSSEGVVSKTHLDLGYRLVWLKKRYVRHIGDDRHVLDPLREMTGVRKLHRSVNKRLQKLEWKFFPNQNPYPNIHKRFKKEHLSMKNWENWNKANLD